MRSSTSSSDMANKALLRIVSFFAATLAIAILASEALVRLQVLPQDNYANHVSILMATDRPDVAFGDSRTARGFVAGDGFVNLAFPSEGISHMAWKAETHFAELQPGRVILQADPHFFAPYRLNRRFEPYPELSAEFASPKAFHMAEPRHRVRLPGYWVRFIENGFILNSKIMQTGDGALLSPGDFAALDPRAQMLQARKRAIIHQTGASVLVKRAQVEYAQMLDALVEKGAEVCLVSYPVSQAYMAAVGSSSRDHIRFFKNEAQRTGVRYVDARTIVPNQHYFRDSDHLNAAGAKVFSNTLVSLCFG
ncbi:hypothetical protein [Ruegeria atlantica]|uniref:hypothetical protein n=1 Tax=Ruegeria atlantica TaxID=81569 RepID=UPI00147E3F58|nr:hypothetical protein [Ruegeria atlantica]